MKPAITRFKSFKVYTFLFIANGFMRIIVFVWHNFWSQKFETTYSFQNLEPNSRLRKLYHATTEVLNISQNALETVPASSNVQKWYSCHSNRIQNLPINMYGYLWKTLRGDRMGAFFTTWSSPRCGSRLHYLCSRLCYRLGHRQSLFWVSNFHSPIVYFLKSNVRC